MNKNLIYTSITMAVILIATATGCKKETVVADDSAQYQPELIINDADNSYNTDTYTGGDETTEFTVENEGLPESYTIVETDMDDAGYKRANVKRFFACMLKLDLSDTQIAMIRKSVKAFEACKFADIRDHRDSLSMLIKRSEGARKELISKLRNQTITKAQFEKSMQELREKFTLGLKKIKLSHAKQLKSCYDKFLRGMKEILTERQWKAFVNCYR
ncbi:MAG TPA: hypothetical protein VGF79_10875 [Bacteroidia bacterium]